MDLIREWLRRHFSDPQAVVLTLLLLVGVAFVLVFGSMLGPVIAGLVIAYILQAPVAALQRRGVSHGLAVAIVFLGFLGLIAYAVVKIAPVLTEQLTQLVVQLPSMIARIRELLLDLPARYPQLVSSAQVEDLTGRLQTEVVVIGQNVVTYTVGRLANLFSIGVYLFLVPLIVFFFLKDRDRIVTWIARFLPEERALSNQVWNEVDRKIGAYMRGKVFEIAIVGSVSWIAFLVVGLDFALLLAFLSGVSVLIPYIGVVAAAIPVVLVALFQFGFGGEFAVAVGAYAGIQLLDGNLLAPLLISEAVDLHPVAVISAILIFGGLGGFWGVFFAIPLATLALAVLNAWPSGPGPVEPAEP